MGKVGININNKDNKRYGFYYKMWWLEEDNNDHLNYFHNVNFTAALKNLKILEEIEYCDNLEELKKTKGLFLSLYGNTPRPEEGEPYWMAWIDGRYQKFPCKKDKYTCINPEVMKKTWEHNYCKGDVMFNGGKNRYWGYALLNFEEEKFLQVEGDLLSIPFWKTWNTKNTKKKDLELLDIFFRKPGEIPSDYKWDSGEYLGWLQYRWGNGLNAISLVDAAREKKLEKRKEQVKENLDIMDNLEFSDLEEKYDKEIAKEIKNLNYKKYGW